MRLTAGLAACLLAVFPVAVPAQDRDSPDYRDGYRRGYDDGFAAGFRKGIEEASRNLQAAPPPPPPPPRPTGPITVTRAVYGSPSRSCDATRFVRRQAEGRMNASFEVTNEMCGDPARGDRKQLEIAYICGTIAKTATAYEHRSVYLDCTH